MERKNKRIGMAFIGIILTAVSVGIFRYADFGVDPYCVLLTGLAKIFHTSFTMAANVTCALLLLFAWKMKKSLVGVSTLLNLLIYGVVADAVFAALKSVYETQSLIVRIVCLVSALFLLAFSGAMYYTADLGVSTYDAIALIMDDRKIGKFKYCRIAADLTCLIAGILAGGEIGIATVIIALTVGPLIQYFSTNLAEPFLEGRKIPAFLS